jgi:hypothetical protein
MQLVYFSGRGLIAFANFHSFCAPRFELAAGFMQRQIWWIWIPRDTVQSRFVRGLALSEIGWQAAEQRRRVGMLWRGEDICGGTNFGDAPGVEDKDAIREASQERGIVSDENDSETEFLPKGPEELQDFLLRSGVEGRGGFIGDKQGSSTGDGLGNEHSLALATAQFVRVGAGDAFCVCGKNRREKLADFSI